jgi:hypothetical protein
MSDQFWLTRARRTRHHALHSTASQAPVARNLLQDFVSTAPQGREHVRKAKRPTAYLNALRPLRPHILQRYLHRGNRYLLARSMSPEPNTSRVCLPMTDIDPSQCVLIVFSENDDSKLLGGSSCRMLRKLLR